MSEVITASLAKQLMDSNEGYVVVDVRENSEYKSGHIAQAINVPLSDLVNQANLLLPDKKQPLLIHCRSGVRSALATKMLEEIGYEKIYDFGGILDWPYGILKWSFARI